MRLLYFASICLLASCTSGESARPEVEKKHPLISFVDSFQKAHPDMHNNDVLKKKYDEQFTTDLTVRYQQGMVNGLPVKLRSIKEYKPGAYAAHFNYGEDFINLDEIVLIEPSLVDSLVEGRIYKVSGRFKSLLSDEYLTFTNRMAYSDKIAISDQHNITAGIILLDSATIIKQRLY